ncbi:MULTISPECIES: transporter [Burkholderiales]|uniref:MetA-pathway of phenol degradation family protein n=1 Tax=Burkholderia cepacia TaxID=292 RepID=Q93L09_BURCE|nr:MULTISPECIES: transporter [Burkholderiales]AAK81684.1 unknown [Burkholderia cepacia]
MEGFLAGAVPPPGLYVLEYATAYSGDSLRDNQGARVPLPTFGLHVRAAATRIIWSTPQQLLGGNLVAHTILPLLDLKVDVPGASQHRSGLGDITVGAGIAWHHSPKWHSVAALDFVLPTGSYDKNDAANLGRNYVSMQPLYAMSYIDPQGFNGDFTTARTPRLLQRSGEAAETHSSPLTNGWSQRIQSIEQLGRPCQNRIARAGGRYWTLWQTLPTDLAGRV